jgi:hypothetical protein
MPKAKETRPALQVSIIFFPPVAHVFALEIK